MSILIEAAGVGPTYSCRHSINIPADGGRFVDVACEFVFNRRKSSDVDAKVAALAQRGEAEGSPDDQALLIAFLTDEIVSMTINARGSMKSDAVLSDSKSIAQALDVAGVPMQVLTIWKGSQAKAKRGN